MDARPKKTEKEPVAKVAPAPGKERLKAGASRFAEGRDEVGEWVWPNKGGQALGWVLGSGGEGNRVQWGCWLSSVSTSAAVIGLEAFSHSW